ncbi:MAG: OmpH family outer membrane protein [Planctomycetes bacterium]|nr:OmpH family outer membrane protein [Planctomycetota bacterium]
MIYQYRLECPNGAIINEKGKIMKLKSIIVMVLVIVMSGFIMNAWAADKCLKIGVVSVRKIFQDCKRNTKYRQEMSAERDKLEAELESLSKDIDASKSKLKMLKPGSADYLSGMKDVLDKQGSLQAKQEYFKRQMDMREQVVVEQLFKDVVKATGEVAKNKGFDIILEKSEPDLPAANSNELTLTISTHKVLYSAGCEDITNAVMAKVDANSI